MSNLDSITSSSNEGSLINWPHLWMIAKRHYRIFLWVCIPVIVLTLLYILIAPSVYESTAVVQVEQREQRAIQPLDKDSNEEDLTSEDSVKTIEQNMQSYDLFEEVVKNPQVANDPNFLVGYTGKRDPTPTSDLADWLQSNTKIALRHGTRLIDITVDHRVPEMAQKLAQSIVDTYTLLGWQNQTSSQQATSKLLTTESAGIKQNLQTAEASLDTFKDLLGLKSRIDAQQTVIDGLKERYREKHPQMIQARQLLSELDGEFDQEFQKTMANPSNADAIPLDSASAAAPLEDRVTAELKLVEARSDVLQKEVDTESALFNNVLQQMRESTLTQDSAATAINLVGPAALPTKAAKPHRAIILLLGAAMGIFLGLSAVVGLHAVQRTIDTPMEAEMSLGLPVLGTILEAPAKKGPGGTSSPAKGSPPGKPKAALTDQMVVLTDPGGASAEGFRSLRAVINLLGKASEHRTILFTSALPGEGKTFVSCNYAMSLAQIGTRTLLVDLDLRRPEVHNRLKLERQPGFVEMVVQELPLSKVVHAKVAKNLDVVTAGGPCPNPAEILAGTAFKEFLAKALEEYDRVVVDTSPINLVSDCLLIAPDVDTVCLVIRAGSTTRQAPQHALSQLRRAQKEPSGIILNAIMPGSDRLYLGYKGRSGVGTYGMAYS
ncbi:MAG: polysaccharide biosynthesis tyrosine autokinase [Methylacidiphilales bacterium]|nr:polysaccharide biosynthesis tyrosine autokinase [Candidatus Methylacidiphilales bacterium]